MHVDDTQTDEQLAARVQRGETDAFGILVSRYAGKLRRYSHRFLSSDDDIEDIVQDVFVSVYRTIQDFDTSLRFSPWIYRIAHNACVNHLRKSQRISFGIDFDTVVPHLTVEEPLLAERELADMRAQLEKGLGVIDAKYREILVLRFFEELSYKDISDILQIPIGTVGIRMKRAKEALRAILKETL